MSLATSDALRKAGQYKLQKLLLERLVALIDDSAKSEKLDNDSLEQKSICLKRSN